MRLETFFGITHEDRIRSALSMKTNEIIESSFCDKTDHYCQFDKHQFPWSQIVHPKFMKRCKRLNSFIKEKLHINCSCFVIYKFLNFPRVTKINRKLGDKEKHQVLTYTLSLKDITNEFPLLEKLFIDVQNTDRFMASQMLAASLLARTGTIGNRQVRSTRLITKPKLYLRPLIGGVVVGDKGGVEDGSSLVLSLPLDISKFVLRENVVQCLHTSIGVVRCHNRSHDEGETFYNVCNLCYKTIKKLPSYGFVLFSL